MICWAGGFLVHFEAVEIISLEMTYNAGNISTRML